MSKRNSSPASPSVASILRRRKWLILIITILITAAGLVWTAVRPKVWRAKSILLVPPQNGGLAQLLPVKPSSSPVSFFGGIIQSDRTAIDVAKKTNLTMEKVNDLLDVQTDDMASQVTVLAQDTNSRLALEVVRDAVEDLRSIGAQSDFSIAQYQVGEIKKSLAERSKELDATEEKFQKFYKDTKTVPVIDPSTGMAISPWIEKLHADQYQLDQTNEQIKASEATAQQLGYEAPNMPTSIPGLSEWRDRLVALDYQLNLTKIDYGLADPRVKEIEQQISVTKSQIQSEVAKFLASVNKKLYPNLVNLEFQRLTLDWEVDEDKKMAGLAPAEELRFEQIGIKLLALKQTVVSLRLEYETQRVKSQVESGANVWSVLLSPTIERKPINKNFLLMGALSVLLGVVLGCVIVVIFPGRLPDLPPPASGESEGPTGMDV